MKKIIFLMPYFGKWPEWFPLYLESCRWNSTIDWLFFTDCSVPSNSPPNVQFLNIAFQEYQELVSERLNISFKPSGAYKICDIRPAFGLIHEKYLRGYDYFGFGDIDVIYGNLRASYTDPVLCHNVISTHPDRISGHLCLIKNEEQWTQAFRKIPNWQDLMAYPEYSTLDEGAFTKIFRGRKRLPESLRKLWGTFDSYKRNHLFKERFSTVSSQFCWLDGSYQYPTKWLWKQGKLTVESGEEMMYLHFMNWKSSRYLHKRHGDKAFWESLSRLVDPQLQDLSNGFCISPLGFTPS